MDNQINQNVQNQYVICPNCKNYEFANMPQCRRCGYVFYPQMAHQQPFNIIRCDNCGAGYDFDAKRCPFCRKRKPQSSLSITAQIIAAVAFFVPMLPYISLTLSFIGMIVGIIDLSMNDKRKNHIGSIDGIVVFAIILFLQIVVFRYI